MAGGGIDEVEEAGAAVEFGKEDGGVGLRLGAADPLEAGADAAVVGAALAEHPAAVAAHPHGGRDGRGVMLRKSGEGRCMHRRGGGGVYRRWEEDVGFEGGGHGQWFGREVVTGHANPVLCACVFLYI